MDLQETISTAKRLTDDESESGDDHDSKLTQAEIARLERHLQEIVDEAFATFDVDGQKTLTEIQDHLLAEF